jgi:NAD(P)H-hydrate epimerase
LVFARHALIQGADVSLYLAKDPKVLRTETTRRNYAVLSELKSIGHSVRFYIEKLPKGNFDILVDALLGIGIKKDVSDEYAKIIKEFNNMKGFKVALDAPSGINCDTGKVMGIAVKPDITISFHERKRGLNEKNSGKIVVVDIGIPKI